MEERKRSEETKEEEKTDVTSQESIRDELLVCPITREDIQDPVVDPEGNTYERSAIVDWIRAYGTSPMTRNRLSESQLTPNRAVAFLIERFHRSTRCRSDSDPGIFQIFVKNLSNKTEVIDTDPFETIKKLKKRYLTKLDAPLISSVSFGVESNSKMTRHSLTTTFRNSRLCTWSSASKEGLCSYIWTINSYLRCSALGSPLDIPRY